MHHHRRTAPVTPRPQRGVAATIVALLLFFGMGIIVAFTNRSLVFEQRTSANQYRYTKAFEAADAGLEWTIANLNNKFKVNTSCATDAAGANSFKERYTTIDPNTGAITPSALKPVCVITTGGYACSCPTAGNATVAATGPAFKVEFSDGGVGVVRVTVHGCTSEDGNCAPSGAGSPDGYARVTALVGLLPALSTVPAATLTARANVDMQGAGSAVGVINTDPSTNGITINAGGTIDYANARITTIPGSPPSSSVIPNDTSLSSILPASLFVTIFGMTQENFKSLASVVDCSGGCNGSNITNAMAALGNSSRVLWVEGDVTINSNVSIGDATNPVLMVVNGLIHTSGTMDVTGLVYTTRTWDDTGGGNAFLRGAAVSEESFLLNGGLDFYFDPNVLRTLTTVPGSFTKIPGSWRDF
jgi:Tfp pilus assembly protein PilX